MKRPLIVFGLIGVFAVLLYAQSVREIITDIDQPAPAKETPAKENTSEQVPAPAETRSMETQPAVVEQSAPAMEQKAPVEKPVVEISTPEETPAVKETPVVMKEPVGKETIETVSVKPAESPSETDEFGIVDDMTAGAEISAGRVSLSLKDVELQDVIRLFSRLSNANIIIPDLGEDVATRKVDVNLSGVEWKPSLQAILDTHGLELYEKIPGTEVYSIRQKAVDAPEPFETHVFKLNYASAADITNLVVDIVGEEGTLAAFPARNSVVIQTTAKKIKDIEDIVAKVDLPRQQVFIEAKFLELNDEAQRDVGVNWQVLEAYGLKASGLGLDYEETKSYSDTRNKFYDVAGRQYEKATESVVSDLGARPGSFGPNDTRVYGITPTRETLDTETVNKTLTAVLSADDFGLVLSALEQQDGVDIVSNPKLIVANEQQAEIHLGVREPNIRIERKGGTTDNPGSELTVQLDGQVPYFEDGVKVVVTPTINTSSNITVVIEPELTAFISRKKVEQDGYTLVDFPVSKTKRVKTVFSLESGQTAAIGGLTQTTEQNVEKKIPVLGNLPVLKRLFSYEQTVKKQDETIIFVTVGLANPSNINMETGLPEKARLAQRYAIREQVDQRLTDETLQAYTEEQENRFSKEMKRIRGLKK